MITIRPAIPADQPEIEAILAASPEAANWADTYPILVADVDNQITAFLLYRQVADECEILNLAVHPAHRRQGLAKHLIRRLLFLDPHITQWHLEVRESNQAAIDLYQYFGFTLQGRRPKYYSDGETALLLGRRQDPNILSIHWLAGVRSHFTLREYFPYEESPGPIIDRSFSALTGNDAALQALTSQLIAQAKIPSSARVLDVSKHPRADSWPWTVPDASVDFILCRHQLYNLPSSIAAAREMRRILAPQGKIIAIEPDFSDDPLLRPLWCKLFPEPRQGSKLIELFEPTGTTIQASGQVLTPTLRQLTIETAKPFMQKHNLALPSTQDHPISNGWIIAAR